MIKYTIQTKQNLAGYFCLVTVAGNTRHGTGYYKTEKEAEEAARQWIAGMREMEKASQNPTPIG